MSLKKLLVANRGEIAIRIVRAAAEMDIVTVGIYSEDDAQSLHTRKADAVCALAGVGVAPYLDIGQIVGAAVETGCDAVHPGYGFLSENAAFARRCAEAGLVFVGPAPETLGLFGDKAAARGLARRLGVPVLDGTEGPTSLDGAKAFLAGLGPDGAIMIKALAGGGGRGMRPVHHHDDLASAYERCRAEAQAAFGNGDVYVERLFPRARHVEVQIVGDGTGAVSHLWERECSVQRQRQKLIEIAPAPGLGSATRTRLLEAATRLAEAVRYRNLGTFEFLVDATGEAADVPIAFIEANARLQVEHTVTEEIIGIDLVKVQLEIAGGASLLDLDLTQASIPAPRGMALQARVNMETMQADGSARPAGGVLAAFEPPTGPGIRVDAFGYAGYRTSPRFDSLLAKLIVHVRSGGLHAAADKAYRALSEFRILGVATNIGFLQTILRHPEFRAGHAHTRLVEEHIADLVDSGGHRRLFFETTGAAAGKAANRAGVKVDASDPLAVLLHGREGGAAIIDEAVAADLTMVEDIDTPEGTTPFAAPMQGTVVSIAIPEGAAVRAGQLLLVMEAMKMQHEVRAPASGMLLALTVAEGDTVFEGHKLGFIQETDIAVDVAEAAADIDLDHIRPDLAEVLERRAWTLDAARPEAVARRRKTGQRTVRENIADLCDLSSFVEYGGLVIAARRLRASIDELIRTTPADGLVAGLGRVNGALFPDKDARCIIMSYDYTVLAGTQGKKNHAKKDRMFELAEKWRLPVVLFAEGGGGRPGDTDTIAAANLITEAFNRFSKLSGLVPLVGITSGRCFAGNAVLLGCCDVIIATANSTIGMGGPAMIEGGGLGVFKPEEVGPMSVQVPNGVVDIAVADEAEAVDVARRYIGYFQGSVADWACADQRLLRRLVPENRLRVYDVREVIDTMADTGSVLEVRRGFGHGMITAFVRIEGRPIGIIANNPMHLGGAIDSDASDKAARFLQLCDAYDIPIVSLCDTPGNMVGPEYEKTGLVRHCCRMFVIGANVTVPIITIVLRKAYGLGAQGMAGAGFHAPLLAVAWPTGEFGGMGLEGAVKLGYRNELAAIADPAERKATYDRMVAEMYEKGKALSVASLFELDDVIDPADTRRVISEALRACPQVAPRTHKKHAWIDTW